MNYAPDLIATTIKMLGSLAVVLGGMFVVFYFMKKALHQKAGLARNSLIRVLASNYVGVKKSISLIQVPDAILVLGITNDHISLLSKIEDKDVISACTTTENAVASPSFSEHFHRISGRLVKKERNP